MHEGRLAYFYAMYDRDDPIYFCIGSTWNMVKRKSKHKKHKSSSLKYGYFDSVGRDRMEFEILEERYCQDLEERFFIEQWFIDTFLPPLNEFKAYRTKEEKNQYKIKYGETHKYLISYYNKQYQKQNKNHQNQRFICPFCGISYARKHRTDHIKTNRHQKSLL